MKSELALRLDSGPDHNVDGMLDSSHVVLGARPCFLNRRRPNSIVLRIVLLIKGTLFFICKQDEGFTVPLQQGLASREPFGEVLGRDVLATLALEGADTEVLLQQALDRSLWNIEAGGEARGSP